MASANLQSRISLDATKFQAGLRSAGLSAKKFSQSVATSVTNTGKRILSLAANVTGLGAAIGGIAGSVSVFRTLGEAVKQAANIETLTTSFEVLLGSGEKAVSMLKELEQFANATPFKMDNLAQGAQTLLSFGVTSEEVLPLLRQLGDVSQGNGQKFQSLTLAFGQMASAGRLMGQDLLQMINVGFNPLQEISKRTGESMTELKERMGKGAISVQEVKQAFMDATSEGGQFFDMMQKQSQTTIGLISTIRGSWDLLLQKLGTPITDAMKPALEFLIVKLNEAQGAATAIGEKLGEGLSLVLEAWQSNQITDLIAKGFRLGFVKGLQGIHGVLVEVISEAIAQTFIPRYGKSTGNEWDPIAGTGDFLNVGNAQAEFDQVIDSLKKSRKQHQKNTKAEEQRQKDIESGREWSRRQAQKQAEEADSIAKSQKAQKEGWKANQDISALLKDQISKAVFGVSDALSELTKDPNKPENKLADFFKLDDVFSKFRQAGENVAESTSAVGDKIKESGQKAGEDVKTGGGYSRLAFIRAGETIAAAASTAAQTISGQQLIQGTAKSMANIKAQDPNFQKSVQNIQKFFAEEMLPTGSMMARELQAEIDRSGFTQSVMDRITLAMNAAKGLGDPLTGRAKPGEEVKPAPVAKTDWGKAIADALGVRRTAADQAMGPTSRIEDPYGRQSYQAQREANQLAKKNQSELQGINSRLQGLGLIGA